MNTRVRILAAMTTILFVSMSIADEQGVIGIWQTEASERGYLHVSIKNCDEALCGKIIAAFSLEGEPSSDFEHIGKDMVWDMKSKGATSWSKGKIWDPTKDKTYKSKMTLAGDTLSVSGCVLMVCRGQDWTRVK